MYKWKGLPQKQIHQGGVCGASEGGQEACLRVFLREVQLSGSRHGVGRFVVNEICGFAE